MVLGRILVFVFMYHVLVLVALIPCTMIDTISYIVGGHILRLLGALPKGQLWHPAAGAWAGSATAPSGCRDGKPQSGR